MFGFGKKQSKADAAIAVMPQAIEAASEKWRFFCEKLVFKAEVPLADRIASFTVPFFQGARQNIPALKEAPDAVLLLIVAKGIERSGTHTKAQIEQALGTRLPD
ncbi:hypothetical protein [uncultured Sphingomonas sp.]|uniref:hypothetical protein n=1 Tax=uncultured Sphingomonas sp. TaxID=158754 RepID=UPI0026390DCC|nr:hypothetical protein [uncultured Sphingomonas sp.]